jgi:hypothetical protein
MGKSEKEHKPSLGLEVQNTAIRRCTSVSCEGMRGLTGNLMNRALLMFEGGGTVLR